MAKVWTLAKQIVPMKLPLQVFLPFARRGLQVENRIVAPQA